MKTDLSLTHIPPQALELEESILASCFLGNAEQVIELLKLEHFYKTIHQKIFTTICDLAKRKIQVELLATVNALRDTGQLEEVGGAAYLARLESFENLAGLPIL